MNDNTDTTGSEWRRHWPLVLACFSGVSLLAGLFSSVGLLIGPLADEFGWSRAQVTAGSSMAALMVVLFTPVMGAMVDNWGGRRIALPGLLLSVCSISLLATANGSPTQWLILWAVVGIFGASLNTTVWIHAVVMKFKRDRSMAIAIALGGMTFAGTIAPPLSQWLTDSFGWRMTFLGLGLGWGGVALVLCVLFFFSDSSERQEGEQQLRLGVQGLSMKEAARSFALWRIGLSGLIVVALASGLIIHKAPILIEAGLSRASAAWLTGLSGLAGVAGKLSAGWAMQRWNGGTVGAVLVGLSGFPLLLLLDSVSTPALVVLAMVAISFAGGSKIQIGAFLTSVYAGERNFGKVFGIISSVLAIGSAFGPVLGGLAYDLAGNYQLFVYVGIPATLFAAALLFHLGPYPEWYCQPTR